MSEYFEVTFEVEKSEDVFERFYKAMIASGVTYKSGFMSDKPESLADIILVNQNGLNNNQRDGVHCRQIVLDYYGFSEVRLYHQSDAESTTVGFCLIVPEEDLCTYEDDGARCHQLEKMEALKCLAIKMWESIDVLAIQTAWECSGVPWNIGGIENIAAVQAEPFAIIKKSLVSDDVDAFQTVGQDGVLVEYKENWLYV